MIRPLDDIKLEVRGKIKTHVVVDVTDGEAWYVGGSISVDRLCKVGDFWLEMTAPTKEKPKSEPEPEPPKIAMPGRKQGRPTQEKTTILIDGENYVSAIGAFQMGANTTKTAAVWYGKGWLKMCRVSGVMYFKMLDVADRIQKRSPIGRIIDGRQYYTAKEIKKRTGISTRTIGQWAKDGKIHSVLDEGALIVLSWAGVQNHLKIVGMGKL